MMPNEIVVIAVQRSLNREARRRKARDRQLDKTSTRLHIYLLVQTMQQYLHRGYLYLIN